MLVTDNYYFASIEILFVKWVRGHLNIHSLNGYIQLFFFNIVGQFFNLT